MTKLNVGTIMYLAMHSEELALRCIEVRTGCSREEATIQLERVYKIAAKNIPRYALFAKTVKLMKRDGLIKDNRRYIKGI